MTQEEIKQECEQQYAQIKTAEERLKELRSGCQHPDTFQGLWSYRIGNITPAIICSDCGTLTLVAHLNLKN